MPDHHHRAGGLRQTNKKNKRSTASKRSVSRVAGGKVMGGGSKNSVAAMVAQSKADRRNHAQQKRDTKRQELMRKKRIGFDQSNMKPPRLIGIISLSPNTFIEDRVRSFITSGADKIEKTHHNNQAIDASISCHFEAFKKEGKLTIVTCQSLFGQEKEMNDDDAVFAAMDLARICDMILFVIDGNTPRLDGTILDMTIGGDDEEQSTSTGKSKFSQDWDHLISSRGDRILAAVKGQGLPTPITVLANTKLDVLDNDQMTMQSMKSVRRSKIKRQLDIKKYVSRFAETEFGTQNNKVLEIDLFTDLDEEEEGDEIDVDVATEKKIEAAKLVRSLCTMACSPAKWVELSPRSYLASDNYVYHDTLKELHLTGYLRGAAPFDVNLLLHVPNLGTYTCKAVKKALPPFTRQNASTELNPDVDTTILADPEFRESLNMFATPDALDGEQNLVGFDENDDITEGGGGQKDEKIMRPAGWSDYQATWLDAFDGETGTIVDETNDRGELADELNKKNTISGGGSKVSDAFTDGMDLDDYNDVNATERQALLQQRKKQQNEELEFPDEVQVDEDGKAHERYARYRSLKSFRQSQWDPKENLPETFANIYHFSSFKQTQRSVMNDMKELVREAESLNGKFWGKSPSNIDTVNGNVVAMKDNEDNDDDNSSSGDDDFLKGCVPSGSYVTLVLENVPEDAMEKCLQKNSLLTAVTLLQHENKISVLHIGLSQSTNCDSTKDDPIKSKDLLTFRCGWRTWQSRPVFSQNNLNCDKHKFERFLPTGGAFFAASVFGPVTYTPCPVLVFREKKRTTLTNNNNNNHDVQSSSISLSTKNNKTEFVALGSMLGADADRIVVKRIILTGYPVRVHKRFATVKYMFYNPEDVKWFKPAELYTKHGLHGNIIQSVGEHGTMKCLFNAPIKQHDTVCLPLYKRIFPKYENSNDTDVLIIR